MLPRTHLTASSLISLRRAWAPLRSFLRSSENRIYKFVLVEENPVKLQSYQPSEKLYYNINGRLTSRFADKEVAPVNHSRDSQHRGQHWNGMFWTEIPSKTALTQVNKQLNSEASSILYGCNTFDFTTTVALERFLNQIGDNKKYLRAVGLSCCLWDMSLPRAIEP